MRKRISKDTIHCLIECMLGSRTQYYNNVYTKRSVKYLNGVEAHK